MLGRAAILLCAFLATVVHAQGTDLVFAVTEGVTYQATPKEIRDKFAPLAEVIGKAAGRRVKMVLVPPTTTCAPVSPSRNTTSPIVHPAHVSMAEIKAGRYKAIAWTTGFTEYTVSLLMKPDAPLKTMDDLKGRKLVTPDPDSITAVMVRAMFRGEKLTRDRGPGAAVDYGARHHDALSGRGAVLSREWIRHVGRHRGQRRGQGVDRQGRQGAQRVRARCRSSRSSCRPRCPTDEQQRIREALLGLRDSKPGREALEAVGYKGFVAPNPEFESSTIAWLGPARPTSGASPGAPRRGRPGLPEAVRRPQVLECCTAQ